MAIGRNQIKRVIDQYITDPLNNQITPSIMRMILKLLVDNSYNKADDAALSEPTPDTTPANNAPLVSLSVSDNNITTSENATFTVSASDVDGNITKVQLYKNGIFFAERLVPPFTFNIIGSSGAGSFSFHARAFDDKNLASNSNAINFIITAPISEVTYNTELNAANPEMEGGYFAPNGSERLLINFIANAQLAGINTEFVVNGVSSYFTGMGEHKDKDVAFISANGTRYNTKLIDGTIILA